MRRSQDHPAHTEQDVAKNTAGGGGGIHPPPPGEIGLNERSNAGPIRHLNFLTQK